MNDRLDLHLKRRAFVDRAQRRLPRLTGNLRQLGARGPLTRPPAPSSQSVIVTVNVTQAHTTSQHLSYLTHGKGPDGQDATLFGPGADDRHAFMQAAQHDPRQFRLVVSPAITTGYDRTQFAEGLMDQIHRDLGLTLAWVAAHHDDTAHPHTHIAVRGVDAQDGAAFFLHKHYMFDGIKHRAQDLLTAMVGPRVQKTTQGMQLAARLTALRDVLQQQGSRSQGRGL